MVKMNVWKRMFAGASARTHEGAKAQRVDAKTELRRSVLTCLLWEDAFYEKGSEIAERIAGLVAKSEPAEVAALACEARDAIAIYDAVEQLLKTQ
jgi:60 kDa SS-A/Ro ribonucleoprotein